MHSMSPSHGRSTSELRLVILLALYLPVVYLSLLRQRSFETVLRMEFPGWDFHFWYDAAAALLQGDNPYSVQGFPGPPVSLAPAIALSGLSFDTAWWVFLLVNIGLCVFALWFATRSMAPGRIPNGFWLVLLFFVASNPAQMLLERGNTDGIVLALLAIAIFARNRIFAGLALAGGILIKV